VMASGVAMILGALNVYYRDFRYVLPLVLQFWMYASPVAYPLTAVPERLKALYAVANLATGLLDSFNRVLTKGEVPDPKLLAVSAIAALLVAIIGYWFFK